VNETVRSGPPDTGDWLQTVFDLAPESIHIIDGTGRIIKSNRYACESSGYTEAELNGRPLRDLFTEESQKSFDTQSRILMKRGFNRANYELIDKAGSIRQVDCVATAIRDGNGDINGFVVIHRDITDQMQAALALEDSERRFQAIFNSTFQLIGLIDPAGTLLEVNRTALEFHGVTAEEVIGKPFWEVGLWSGSPGLQERIKSAVREAAEGKLVRCEVELVRKNGEQAVIDFSLNPVIDDLGKTVLIIPEGRDITQRKRTEEKAVLQQRELAHFMRLSNMGEVAASLAHQLNQPLTALVSYCETARSLLENSPSQKESVSRILNRATEQAHRAAEIIQHLRDFIGKGEPRLAKLDLDEVIRGLVDFLEPELKNAGVMLELQLDSGEHRVAADRIQIEQVLVNLIWNSLEAISSTGLRNGRITVRTNPTAHATVEVSVEDNGPGVAADMEDRLFESFQTSKTSGMGLGLSISRSITESYGGKLWLDRNYRSGARFTCEIPLKS